MRRPASHRAQRRGERDGDDRPVKSVGTDPVEQRLVARVAAQTDGQRARLALDAVLVDALLHLQQPEAAVRALDDYRIALLTYAEEVRDAVAEAVADRQMP